MYDVNSVFIDKDECYYTIFIHLAIARVYCIGTVMPFDMMLYLFEKHANTMFLVLRFTYNVESCFATCLTFTMRVSLVVMCFQGAMIGFELVRNTSKHQKLLLIMMLRNINDCHETIGKFLILNNVTYSKVRQ
ncbi:uncharacterized protein LOC117173445 [Belonocnema kinseyi]|uniref:uncharacterized protein LOC117173445 n=1 Tax=Belonocnema kinseyi TaxID=2817044 RepID=UPI00143DC718|nr:uncharacterized protein LOC117173445 [Belonocnema kinseyi]